MCMNNIQKMTNCKQKTLYNWLKTWITGLIEANVSLDWQFDLHTAPL